MIKYRKMLQGDIGAGLALCRSAGWNQLENDWKFFLHLSSEGSRVAIDDEGKVVGTVTTINYENRFSWIGMVLVDPEKKRQGIGTQLLLEALNILKEQETVKLDATPAGREVYLKLGFKDEYMLSRMVLDHKANVAASTAFKISDNDLEGIFAKDKGVFGASRAELLQLLYSTFKDLSLITESNSYSFGRRGYNFTQIGPVVANTIEDAKQLVVAVLSKINGSAVIDVADNSPFQQWLQSIGFAEQRKLIRMYRGTNAFTGDPGKQYAILGPEFG